MKEMLSISCLLALSTLLSSEAEAGHNAGGALILHANPNLQYSTDSGTFVGLSGISRCEDAVTRVDRHDTFVFHLLAAFPPDAAPALAGVEFALDYDPDQFNFIRWGNAGEYEFPLDGWPAPRTGTALLFMPARTERLVEVYWFAGYAAEEGPTEIKVCATRRGLPVFADSDLPPVLDDVGLLGALGIETNGLLPCPESVPPQGACCSQLRVCYLTTAANCESDLGVYLGDDSICTSDVCTEVIPGRCCLEGDCVLLDSWQCLAAGGNFLGNDVPCAPGLCGKIPTGACCLSNGSCLVASEAHCGSLTGSYQGDGTTCGVDACFNPPGGACCYFRGCIWCTEQDCLDLGGVYYGDGVACAPELCPGAQMGACCSLLYGVCQLSRPENCAGPDDHFIGLGSSCDPNPCLAEPGACCLTSGTCLFVTAAACADLGPGEFLGVGMGCEPDPCTPLPTGACCLAGGECILIDRYSCGEGYQGDGVPCDSSPCDQSPSPTQRSTWGGIKSHFR